MKVEQYIEKLEEIIGSMQNVQEHIFNSWSGNDATLFLEKFDAILEEINEIKSHFTMDRNTNTHNLD